MFGLFSKTPEERLKDSLIKAYDKTVRDAYNDFPAGTFSGLYINLAISGLYKAFNKKSAQVSAEYNLPLSTVDKILKDCTNITLSKYLENGEDYFV